MMLAMGRCLRGWRGVVGVLTVTLMIAGYAFLSASVRLEGRLPLGQHGMSVRVQGHVVDVPRQRADRCEFLLETRTLNGREQRLRLQVRWYGEDTCQPLRPGHRWELVLRLALPRAAANPGLPSRERRWFRAHVDGRAWVRAEFEPRCIEGHRGRAPIARARRALAQRMRAALPSSVADAYPLLAALTLGLGKPFSPSVRDALTATGTGHLFAISGLHIGLLGALCLALGKAAGALRRRPAPSRWPSALALGAAGAYAVLAGFTVPTQRALLALAVVVVGARLLRRSVGAASALGLALVGVLLLDPFAPLDEGFWLSFLAVSCLLIGRVRAPAAPWWALAQLRLGLGLVPIGLWVFGQVSIVAPLANLLVVPLFGVLIVPLSLLGVLLAAVAPALAAAPLWVAGKSLLAVLEALEWAGGWPGARLSFPYGPSPWMLLTAQVGVLLLFARGLPGRWVGAGLGIPLLASLLVVSEGRGVDLPPGAVRVTLLDVGQGLASVVQTRNHVMLYDAGPAYYGGGSAGGAVVMPYLASLGVRSLDRVVISHGDSDHAGGLDAVLRGYADTAVLAGGGSSPWPACRAGQRWEWDDVHFAVLHPSSSRWKGNDGSCVLRVSVGQGAQLRSVLLTGDIQHRAEAHLVQRERTPLKADVVVAPHHGSASSSTPAFVAATTPQHVLFACGFSNRWNFPHPAVLARWRDAGAATHVTGSDGALTVTLRPGEVSAVTHERRRGRRYWSVP